jgi:hypothetical protein
VNGLGHYVQRPLKVALLCVGVAIGPTLGTEAAYAAGPTEEVSPAALVAARELFREATEDVDAGRYEVALDKFKRVAAVKETAAVRFNIGRCEESLGRTGTALADFELAEREARSDPHGGDEIARLAHEHADSVRPKVPRLSLVAPKNPPEGLVVSLDGGKLSTGTLGVALPVDPGKHTVEASAPGRAPFRAQVDLKAGETKQIAIAVGGTGSAPDDPDAVDESRAKSRRTIGYVVLGSGIVLGAGAVVVGLVHASARSDLDKICPNGECPASEKPNADELNSKRSTAETERYIAIGLGAASVVAVGVGAYFLLTKPSPSRPAPAAWLTPTAPGAAAGLSLHVTY